MRRANAGHYRGDAVASGLRSTKMVECIPAPFRALIAKQVLVAYDPSEVSISRGCPAPESFVEIKPASPDEPVRQFNSSQPNPIRARKCR
jgi:hypothetical protein